MEQLNLHKIISEISPLYNKYKDSNRSIPGTEALKIMWEIGDILSKEIDSSNIAPHNLYRKIYGKAEGKTDIIQKSYITREFLGRSYRIRNIFKNKTDIEKTLPSLRNFISFREAMPFFDNEKYVLIGEERLKLLSILNSKENPTIILKKIKLIQASKIGIKNPRNQKLDELEPKKEFFTQFYNYLFNLIKNNNYFEAKEKIKFVDDLTLSKLSSNTSALTQEGLKFVGIQDDNLDDNWNSYLKLLEYFSLQDDAKERRRFRRLISPNRIVKLAEMINAITSEDSFIRFKK